MKVISTLTLERCKALDLPPIKTRDILQKGWQVFGQRLAALAALAVTQCMRSTLVYSGLFADQNRAQLCE